MSTPTVRNYNLRGLPPDVWQAMKLRAASEGRTIRFVVETLLRHYVAHGFPDAKIQAQAAAVQNYVINRVDAHLWDQMKARAKREGRSIHYVLEVLLAYYAEHGFPATNA